jgi:hypothetical protein
MIKSKVYNAELKGNKHDNVLLKFKVHSHTQEIFSNPNSFNLRVRTQSAASPFTNAIIVLVKRRRATELNAYIDITKPLVISLIVGVLASIASFLADYNYITALITLALSSLVFIISRQQMKKDVVRSIERIINS